MWKVLLVVSAVAFAGSLADALLKLGATVSGGKMNLKVEDIRRVMRSKWVGLGLILMFLNAFVWIKVLSFTDLSIAYPMYATSYIFAAMWSMFLFGEHLPLRRWLGIAIIIFGVYMVSKG